MKAPLILLLVLVPVPLCADRRTSTNYSIIADTVSSGGGPALGVNYSHEICIGSLAGPSGGAEPAVTSLPGFLGQLFESDDYTDDGIDDAWQRQYFGPPPNAQAAPGADPDNDGQDNRFEFVAGLDPTDPSSHFSFSVETIPDQGSQTRLIFRPRLPDRGYTLLVSRDLFPGNWTPLTIGTTVDQGDTRTVTDTAATRFGFYRLEISRP